MADFRQIQAGFTQWLRHPGQAPAPAGVEARRLAIYRELLLNNVTSFVEGTFPVAMALLPAALRERLKLGFFADFHCTSPLFNDISLHFREYVDSLDWPELADYPWLAELLHYEWMELAADIADEPNPSADPATRLAGDGFPVGPEQVLRLAAPTWPLAYQWRVHEWHEDTGVAGLTPAPVCLLAWRDRDERVRVLEVEPLAAWLVEHLIAAGSLSLCALAGQLTAATPGLDEHTALSACAQVLATLQRNGVHFHA